MEADTKPIHESCLMHDAIERTLKSHCHKWEKLESKVNWIFVILIINLCLLLIELVGVKFD